MSSAERNYALFEWLKRRFEYVEEIEQNWILVTCINDPPHLAYIRYLENSPIHVLAGCLICESDVRAREAVSRWFTSVASEFPGGVIDLGEIAVVPKDAPVVPVTAWIPTPENSPIEFVRWMSDGTLHCLRFTKP